MKDFFHGFLNFLIRPLRFIKKHFTRTLFLLTTTLLFYILLGHAVYSLFESFWVGEVFYRFSEKSVFIKMLYLLNELIETPVLSPFQPLMLFLSYSLALSVSKIFTGPVIFRLSLFVQNDRSFQNPYLNTRNPRQQFFFEIKEEILDFCLNFTWSVILFLLASLSPFAALLSLALFFLTAPFLQASVYLSYPFIGWGVPYSGLFRACSQNFPRFLGFSLASGMPFFLIFSLLKILPFTHLLFVSLFSLYALFRPMGVMGGTLSAMDFAKKSPSLETKRKMPGKVIAVFSLLVTLLSFITLADLYLQSGTKLDLLDCRFSIEKAVMNTPGNLKDKNALEKILLLSRFAREAEMILHLQVKNPSRNRIVLEKVKLNVLLGRETMGNAVLEGITLPPEKAETVKLNLKVSGTAILKQLSSKILSGAKLDFEINAHVEFDLWFGKFVHPFSIVS